MAYELRRLPAITPDAIERVWQRVVKVPNGCWLWVGSRNNNGSGMLLVGGESFLASRISYAIANGCDPYPDNVLHNCPTGDNKACVNPSHLYLGDQSQNMKDAYQKGQKPSMEGKRYKGRRSREHQTEIKKPLWYGSTYLRRIGNTFHARPRHHTPHCYRPV